MSGSLANRSVFELNQDSSLIPAVIDRIKETYGRAYSAFSGRPISLCKSLERRGELRINFEEAIYLWPVEMKDQFAYCSQLQPIVSVTRDVSQHGIGFSYDEKIETDFIVVEIDLFGEGTELLLVELRWNSFLAPHSYVGGGLIRGLARAVDTDVEEQL